MPPRLARILFSDSGRGLHTDADLLQQALSAQGWRVERIALRPWSLRKTLISQRFGRINGWLPRRLAAFADRTQVRLGGLGKPPADLQIHLETPSVEYLSAGVVNWLIPNQEWVRPQHLRFFKFLDRVLCKTQEALDIFRTLHNGARYLGFSNPLAVALPAVPGSGGRYRRFLHVAGRNRKKGSKAIVEAWRRHPEWPVLHLVRDASAGLGPIPANVRVHSRLGDEALAELRRHNGIVLAPSEVEGFGHILLEGMAYHAVVLTTDAPPMNELVRPEWGRLLGWSGQEPFHLGTRYYVTPEAVETAMDEILRLPASTLHRLGAEAREWVGRNHLDFLANLHTCLRELNDGTPGPVSRPAVAIVNAGSG